MKKDIFQIYGRLLKKSIIFIKDVDNIISLYYDLLIVGDRGRGVMTGVTWSCVKFGCVLRRVWDIRN